MASKGLYQIDIPEIGEPTRGKVRDNWVLGNENFRLIVTTDRQSIYGRFIGVIPGKGQISNLISRYWCNRTKHIINNHLISCPHPNITLAYNSRTRIPVEVVLRRYMAEGESSTSVYQNYINRRRNIYGIQFPDGLKPNCEFPMGTIITPTTKSPNGLDKMLTDLEACDIVDNAAGNGTWNQIKEKSLKIYELARMDCFTKGLILADTKLEFGIDSKGSLMLIDEIFTPECSRIWLRETYEARFRKEESPDLNKELLSRWLKSRGFSEEGGKAPVLDDFIIGELIGIYTQQYEMITGEKLPSPTSDPHKVSRIALESISRLVGL